MSMRRLLVPFFIVRLLSSLVPFFLNTAGVLLFPVRSFLLTLVFFLYLATLAWYTYGSRTFPAELMVSSSPLPPVFEEEQAIWESYYQLQPTHRDVLLNLALIHQAQGNQEQAGSYLQQARKIDPNYPGFDDITTYKK